MPRVNNPVIGNCPCPICGKSAGVKRFGVRALHPGRTRMGGRLYIECKEHGTFNSTSQGAQDWILNNADIWGPDGKPVPANEIENGSPQSQGIPEEGAFETAPPPAAAARRNSWGFL